MAFAVGDDGAGQGGDRLGQLDGHPPQLQTNVVGINVDLLDGHPADRGGTLGVEQDQHAGCCSLQYQLRTSLIFSTRPPLAGALPGSVTGPLASSGAVV